MSMAVPKNATIELFDAVSKLLGIDDKNATRMVLTLEIGEIPRVEITRLVPNPEIADMERVTQAFEVVPIEKPAISNSIKVYVTSPPTGIFTYLPKIEDKKEPYIGLDGGVK